MNASAPRQRLAPDERRRRILDAAVEVFAERGYQGASMEEIAGRAGVVASVIYDHFTSKRNLYVELLELHGEALIERSVSRIQESEPRERLLRGIEAFFEFVEEDPFVWRFLFRDPPAVPEITDVHREIRDRATEEIASVLESQATPQVTAELPIPRKRAARMLAEAVRAATDGLAAWWYENRETPREHVVAIAMSLLWNGFGGLVGAQPRPKDV